MNRGLFLGVGVLCALALTAGNAPALDLGIQPNKMHSQSPSSNSTESSGTSIYSQDAKKAPSTLGKPPSAPPPSDVSSAEQKREVVAQAREEKPVRTVPVPSPPSSVHKGRQNAQQQPVGSGEMLSLDVMRPIKGDTFGKVAHAVEQSIKAHVTVLPEMPTPVRLSNRDINRITCQEGLIKDVIYSREKGVMINFTGKDAFVKYRIVRAGSRMQYVQGPTELYVSCNDVIYTIIAVPEGIPAQIVRLSGGARENIKKNHSVYGGMALEKKTMALIKAVYTDNIPDTFNVRREYKKYDLFRDVDLSQERIVLMEGEGIQVRELKVSLSQRSKLEKVKLTEKDFLDVEISKSPIGVAIDKSMIAKGGSARVFICEKSSAELEVKGVR